MSQPPVKETIDRDPIRNLPVIPSGSLRLDIALGKGGITCGQFVEISGDESSGKTTLCLHVIANAQRMGRLCAWIDADHTFNPDYARRCGVELEDLYFASPAHAEQALDILEVLAGQSPGSVIVLDPVDALTPRGEFDLPFGIKPAPQGEADESSEKLLSRTLSRLSQAIVNNRTTILFTNRTKSHRSQAYHQLSTHLARLALKLHAGLLIRLQVTDLLRQDEHIIGQRLQAKILKNKNISPTHVVEFDIIYNQGINHRGEVFDLGLQLGLIHKQGEEYILQSLSLGQERGQAIETLERQALIGPMEQVIRQKLLGRSFLAET